MLAVGGAWILRNAQRRQAAEAALAEREAQFRLIAENVTDMVSMLDGTGRRVYVSPSSEALLGYTPAELIGTPFSETIHPDDLPWLSQHVGELTRGEKSEVTVTYRSKRKDGREIWVEASVHVTFDKVTGRPEGAVAVTRDVTARKRLESRLSELALRDQLTGLPNRRAFDETLKTEWERARDSGSPLSILMIDVDRFKAYNDTYGHPAGDECLAQVASALQAVVRTGDTVARFGGEEFAVLLPHTDEAGAKVTAEKLRAAVVALQKEHLGSELGIVTVSVGAAGLVPERDDPSCGALIVEAADQSLYRAKAEGRNRVARSADVLSSFVPQHTDGRMDGISEAGRA